MNLSSVVAETARRLPDKPALVVGQRVCTYAELEAATQRTADVLRDAGVSPGRKVAITVPNGPEFVAGLMGILRADAVAVPCPADVQPSELATMIERVGCEYQIAHTTLDGGAVVSFTPCTDPKARPLHLGRTEMPLSDRPDQRLLDVGAANIRFTSGTTADYKGVVLSHDGIRDRIEVVNRRLGISSDDTIFFGLPMAHHFAASITLHLWVGATIVTGGAFLGDAMLRRIQQHQATVIYTTPVTYRLLADAADAASESLDSVRLAISTAMPLSENVATAFHDRFGVPLTQILGIIEVGMPIMNLPLDRRVEGSIGRVIDGFETRIVDEENRPVEPEAPGQLLVRGPGMLAGYYSPWRNPEEILEEGWFRTGDIVRRSSDGTFFLLGRSKDVINVGGLKVFPYEIEQVLTAHKAVKEAFAAAVPDEILGQVSSAAVVLQEGIEVTAEALVEHCRQHLSHFKVPRTIRILPSLPRTHSGKIARSLIPLS